MMHVQGTSRRLAYAAIAAACLAAVGNRALHASQLTGARRPGTAPVRAERQPVADLGNGRYLNPILAGEYPDPTVARVGADYYMTHTPGPASPGLLVWHSRDLVNWEPLGPALAKTVGDIWAPEIVHRDGLFFIYFPALVREPGASPRRSNFVITAKDPSGPWSDPIDLGVGGIDPGHVVDESGNRYLYLDDGKMAKLSADGLRVTAPPVKVYDGWNIPADWNVECKCLESPKLFRRNRYYYLVSAQGGTAGPSTSHMIVVARSASPTGPWENMPANPLLRTRTRAERWWSQGHGTILEAADGSWWVVYHAFENNFRTLGRQTLLLPVEWSADGWPRIPAGIDPAQDLPKPSGQDVGHGMTLSDGFAAGIPGWQWRWWDVRDGAAWSPSQPSRGEVHLRARGTGPADAALLTLAPVNHAYEAEVELDVPPGVEAGLLLHYDAENFGGIGAGNLVLRTFLKGRPLERVARPSNAPGRVFLRIRNIEHDVRLSWSADGTTWTAFQTGMEMSGYHHDMLRNWGTLKIALFAAGDGTATFRHFRYRGM
jgi:xylan 1,4-beta-xylosidase